MKNEFKYCLGVNSKTTDEKHILMLDYDNIEYHNMIDELRKMQDKYKLGDFLIFKSTNGCNAICLDKFNIDELTNILKGFELVDEKYIEIGLKRGYFVTRMGVDKRPVQIIFGNDEHEKSNAHKIFLNSVLFNFQYGQLSFSMKDNFDNFTHYNIVAYQNEKYGYLEKKEVRKMGFKTIKEYKKDAEQR